MKKVYLFFTFLLTVVSSAVNAQERPLPAKDEIQIPLFIEGIQSKEDVLRVEELMRKQTWVTYFLVEDFPQRHTKIIIKDYVTPEMINQVLKPAGYLIINKNFSDPKDIEQSLVQSRKRMNAQYPASPKF